MNPNQGNKTNYCIAINSTAYFLLAYYLVVFTFNLFSMLITWLLGFDVTLYYYGFTWEGKAWMVNDIILTFFVGNAYTLVTAFLFEFLYRKQRRYLRKIKLLYLWIYLISIIWFFGNVIVGAFFNFGIGTALLAYRVPFMLRALLALISIAALGFFGYRAAKHIKVSANLYFQKLHRKVIKKFVLYQIVIPIIAGLIIVILLKIPEIARYNYVDIYVLLSFVFFIAGLYYNLNFSKKQSITFKSHINIAGKTVCSLQFFVISAAILLILIIRIGLINGLSY